MAKPKIRFKGYTNDWEQRKFGDLADYKKGPFGSAITKDMFVPKSEESIKVYEQQNAINKDWELERYFLPKEYALTKLKLFEVHGGDIIVSCAGTIGEIYEIPENADTGVINQALMRVRVDEDCVDKRMFKIAFSNMIDDFTRVHSNGSAIKNIPPFSDLKPMGVLLPSLQEQKKIGAYFDSLDHLITLHQRKCDQAKKLKKYMLQKMFPKNNKSVPEIRFEGFSNDWEQRRLGEFIKNVAKKNKENLDLEPYAVTNDRGFIAQRDAHDDFGYMSNVDRTAYNIVPPNSFAYNPARINVGSLGYYAGRENVIVSSLYEVFQTEKNIDDKFLWHWLRSDAFPKWIEKLQEGSVRLYFYYDKLIQCQMMVSTTEEQKKIGEYLDSLDHLITLHQKKCDQLKNLKKFMLQNMFV